ncbi:cobalt-zinc-cadmium efflux system protein [Dietzia kunjamensis subsp. schimae]|uniref:Cobalt-zinc-cadmium efflux system protein n=1 Tax=Dietzia kunjamensis subsp. schimae TaxID=498198 RepID=A0ABY1MY34_9ACTN|nr:cation diffusion facilitator family transporter [Dietzia kunjamensis]MBB1014309.1 cation transporter [Dietzia kunjamensis subsp. schimae]SMO46848.1 cobalt-zinc-cadmium efflux system protein [Dietzia kunjamensis subsp. schimae]
MGAGHSHGRPSGHAGARYRVRLGITFALTAAFFGVELVAGLVSGSLALLSDAGHMGADVVALGAALLATVVATRPDASGRRTFGRYRVEIFASGLAVLIMLGMGVYVLIEAVGRLGSDVSVATGTMLVVGALGLVINVISLLLLRSGSDESLAVRGAYLEVLADAAGSVGVIVAALLMRATGSTVWDLVVAVAIAVFIVVRAVVLGRQVVAVLAQHAPAGVDPVEVEAQLGALRDVEEVHDLHLWTLTSGMDVGTVHLVVDSVADHSEVLGEARRVLLEEHGIEHVTVQIETAGVGGCRELGW